MTIPTTVCEACGASNPIDATFCQTCHAFVGWDRTATLSAYADRPSERTDAPSRSVPVETRPIPKVLPDERAPDQRAPDQRASDQRASDQRITDRGPVLAARADQDRVTVPVTGGPAEIALLVTNRSDIVDGYEVDVGGAPGWLRVESSTTSLLPGTEGRLIVRFRIESEVLVAAGEGTVRLRVRSLTQPPAHEIVPVVVVVPVVDAPVRVRTEPSVVRIRDADVARFVLVVDNSQANRPARVRLSGTDPELAVSFHFDPDLVVVGAGETARVRVVTTSPRPQPGAELTRLLTVAATEGNRRVETTVSVVQATSVVVEDPMVELVATPSLVRLRDTDTASVRVRVDNRAGRGWARVRLAASDPEQTVHARWATSEVSVPPSGSTDVDLQLSGPVPDPGTEVTRTVTITASDERRVARTQISMVHSASQSPMTTLGVRLDPSVLRLTNTRRGASTVVVDNRSGRLPVRVWLRGDDPENAVSFTFTPPELTVGPGQALTSRVAVTAPRPPGGREINRPLTVSATDGQTTIDAGGSILQTASDRRPWARVVLTLLGALTMIIGAMLPLLAVSDRSSFGISVDTVAGLFDQSVNLAGFEQLINFGLLIMVIAGLMAFGLTGRSGRLTRWTAVLAVLLTIALLLTVAFVGINAAPGSGALLIIVGAVLGYVGGLLARR